MLFCVIFWTKNGDLMYFYTRHLHLETILTYWVLIYSLIVLQPILNIFIFLFSYLADTFIQSDLQMRTL